MATGLYRGATADERNADRRRRLMDAALDVWSTAGTKVTMTAVCASAGLTERYFYQTFANLDDALTAVLDAIATEIEHLTTAASDAVEASGGGPEERIRASVRALVDYLQADPRTGRVALVEAGAMPGLRHRRTAILRHFAQLTVDDAVDKAGSRVAPSSTATSSSTAASPSTVGGLLLVGGMAELITAWLEGAVQTDAEDIVEATVRMYLALYT